MAKSAMQDWAELIRSIASLLWPILAFVALCMFKQRIHEILGRLRRGKVLGQEIELEQELKQLHETAQAAESETAQVVRLPSTADAPDEQKRDGGAVSERVLEEASRNPKVALIMLASDLEREVRQLLASMGFSEEHVRARYLNPFGPSKRAGRSPDIWPSLSVTSGLFATDWSIAMRRMGTTLCAPSTLA